MPKTTPALSTYTTMMRVNSKDRPYAKDLYDLYSALLIQQPLSDHRSLFRNYPSTFTTDEACENLSHLQFTHLVTTPNPLDASHPLLTRTTTTFSMSRDMAKTLGQHFINARLAENATDPQNRSMKDKGIWTPTPKGKFMIQDFSQRARVSIMHIQAPMSHIPYFPIVQFERLIDDDQLSFARQNMIQAFKVMMEWLPTDRIMIDDIGGVDSANVMDSYRNTFYGYQCFEWIMEYTSVVSNDEAESIAAEFVLYGWIQQVLDMSDKNQSKKDKNVIFKTGRKTQYYLTDKGRRVLEGETNNHPAMRSTGGGISMATRGRAHSTSSSSDGSVMTSNSNKLHSASSVKSTPKKEEHTIRLLPTTAESELPHGPSGDIVVPKAIITKETTTSLIDSVVNVDCELETVVRKPESILQIDNSSCDFGFSSGSSTTSSDAATVYPSGSSVTCSSTNRSGMIQNPNGNGIQEQLERLKLTINSSSQIAADPPHSQDARLQNILKDPLVRMYLRQFLKSNFCEENINFWVDYTTLVKKLGQSDDDDEEIDGDDEFKWKKKIEQLPKPYCHTLLNHCCIIYNTYFCPQYASSELNIDHGLRQEIIQYMQETFITAEIKDRPAVDLARAAGPDAPFGSISVSLHGILTSSVTKEGGLAVGESSAMKQDTDPRECLCKIVHLYELVNGHVCKTMAQDSVPRFIKTQKYHDLMQSYYQQNHELPSESESESESEEYDTDK